MSGGLRYGARGSSRVRRAALRFFSLVMLAGAAATVLAEPPWQRVDGPGFELYARLPPAEVERLGVTLSLFRETLAAFTSVPRPDAQPPAQMVVFADATQFGQFVEMHRARWLLLPSLEGDRILVGPPGRDQEPQQLLLRAYGLHLLRNADDRIRPRWYESGWARFLSTFRWQEETVFLGGSIPALERAWPASITYSNYLGFERLDRHPLAWRSRLRIQDFMVWYYLEFGPLLGQPDRRLERDRFLERFDAGVPWDEAFREAFGIGPARLGSEVAHFWRRRHLPQLELTLTEPASTRARAVRTVDDPEVIRVLTRLTLAPAANVPDHPTLDPALTDFRDVGLFRPGFGDSGGPEVAAMRALAAAPDRPAEALAWAREAAEAPGAAPKARTDAASAVLRLPASARTRADLVDALEWAEGALAAERDGLRARAVVAAADMALARPPERAIALLEDVLRRKPYAPRVRMRLAELHARAGNTGRARRLARRAAATAPSRDGWRRARAMHASLAHTEAEGERHVETPRPGAGVGGR